MKPRALAPLVLLLLFAALLRLYGIDAQSIWADEGFTYLITQQADILPMLRADVHPPLYFLGMKYWAAAAGTSELALRLPSALASVVGVALVYVLGREVVRWRREDPDASPVPLVAALLMALTDIEIDLSHEARMYTVHTALAVLSVIAYLRWSRRPRAEYAWVWGVSSATLVYVNYLGVWTPLVVGVHALFFLRGQQLRHAFVILFGAAATVLPWLLLVGRDQIGNGAGADRADATTLDTLRVYRDNWLGPQWPLMAGLLGLGIIGRDMGAGVRARITPYRMTALLLLWILVPLALTSVANLWLPVLAAHRVSQITPAVCVLVALGIAQFRPAARAFLATVISISALTSVDFYRIKGPWEDYVATVAPFVQPDDLVLMEIGGGDTMLEYYFDRALAPGTRLVSMKRWREGTPDDFYAGVLPLLEQHSTVWLLHWSSETAIFEWLSRTGHVETMYRATPHIQNSRLDAYRFDRLPDEDVGRLGDLRLRSVEFGPEPPRVDLIWSVDVRPGEDLVTSAFLLDEAGLLVAQHDSPPMLGERATSAWRRGEVVYDPKVLQTSGAESLPPGEYTVGVVVYRFLTDGTIERLRSPDGADSLMIGTLQVAP